MKRLAKKFAQIFFGVETAEEMKKEGTGFVLGYSSYWLFEYGLMAVAAAIVVALLQFGWTEREIFIFLWLGNILVSCGIIFTDEKSGVDFTAMNGSRRVASSAWEKARGKWYLIPIFGLFMASWLFWLVFWQGPAAVIIFFQTRKKIARALLLTSISAIQMFIWTKVYIFSYGFFQAIWSLWN